MEEGTDNTTVNGIYKSKSPIIIETKNSIIFHGILITNKGNESNILVDSISEFPSKIRCTDQIPACYSLHEIKYFYKFDQEDIGSRYSLACPSISGITYEQFIEARDMIWDSKYIPVYDCNFQNTLKEIRVSDVLGIAAIGSHSDKVISARISFFVIATKCKIYLFDILLTQKNFWEMGLKNVLEDTRIQKVVYDCKTVNELLNNRYNIKITNVFDVMLADKQISKKELKTFPEIVQQYLHLPKGIFEYTELILSGVTHRNRPASDKMKRDISLVAVFLIHLRDAQKAILLKNFQLASQMYSDWGASRTDSDEEISEGNREVLDFMENNFKVGGSEDVDSEPSSSKLSDN